MHIIKGDLNGKILRVNPHDVRKEIVGYRAFDIIGGEFAVVNSHHEIGITTLLGSCVAIMLNDYHAGLIAMNHFLISGIEQKESYKYGLHSVETMINQMMKMGAQKSRLVAKIAGGAKVLSASSSQIGNKNVEFAREFCSKEAIPIESEHVFGNHGRVILLQGNFHTLVRQVTNHNLEESIEHDEKMLAKRVAQTREEPKADITLF